MESSGSLQSGLETFRSRMKEDAFKTLTREDKSQDRSFSLDSTASSSKESSKAERSEKLMDLANKVEGMFIGLMVKQMRKTVMDSKGPFSGGPGEKMFREQLDSKYANRMAKARKFGIAEQLYNRFASQFGVDKIDTK